MKATLKVSRILLEFGFYFIFQMFLVPVLCENGINYVFATVVSAMLPAFIIQSVKTIEAQRKKAS